MKKLIALKFLFLLGILFILPTLKPTFASTIIFQDNFDNPIESQNKWIVSGPQLFNGDGSPADWKFENGMYGISINNRGSQFNETIPKNWGPTNKDYSFEVDMKLVNGVDTNLVFRYQNHNNWYGIHGINNENRLVLQKAGSFWSSLPSEKNYHFTPDTFYHFKIDVIGERMKVSINGEELWDVTDPGTILSYGTPGLQASTGGVISTEVWFDNVVVTSLEPTPTPTPTPSPTPTPTPTIGSFELPFNYSDRLENNPTSFKAGFWGRLTAAFDHLLQGGTFRPFTGVNYGHKNCPNGALGITCYDGHNGTDFSTVGGQEIFSVGSGTVVYTSEHTDTSCTPNKGGYGCVAIVEYPGNNFGLYAHLDRISVNTDQQVEPSTLIGEMGATGCPNCGEHLHFGIMQSISTINSVAKRMSRKDWKELLYKIKPDQSPRYRPACTYTAPNGTIFAFRDPSGWKGSDIDPWSKPKAEGGCGITSPYLWRFEVGIAP